MRQRLGSGESRGGAAALCDRAVKAALAVHAVAAVALTVFLALDRPWAGAAAYTAGATGAGLTYAALVRREGPER